jgi:Short C-terminal domain
MWSLPVFAGTVLGCFLFAFLLSFIPGLRSRTPGRLLLINIISWAILAVGDNAARGTEDLGETLARIGVAQFVVFLLMLGWATAKQKGAAEVKTQAQKEGAAEVKTQEPDEPQRVVGFSVADEIEKLDRLRKSGLITDQEFARLRTKLVS